MIILRYHEILIRLTAPRCPGMAAGAVSLRKSHDIIILSFCNIVKGQANSNQYIFLQPILECNYITINFSFSDLYSYPRHKTYTYE